MIQAAASWRLEVYETLGSTSELCRARAEAGEPEGLAVLARMQTAGRGSRGRGWAFQRGNLAVSLLLRPQGPAAEAGLWALLAGVALAEALAGTPGIVLKWPNDVLLDGAKLGGILIDTTTDGQGGLAWLVIGIGVNLAHAPAATGRAVASLDGRMEPLDFAHLVLARIAYWRAVADWPALRAAWLGYALPVGQAMTLRQGGHRFTGTFAGLGEDGSLQLEVSGTICHFNAGEIWLATDRAEIGAC